MKPSTLLVIASVERTGSSLLCSILRQTGVAGTPIEYLNIHTVNFAQFREDHGVPRISPNRAPTALLRRLTGRQPWTSVRSFTRGSWRKYLRLCAEVNTTANGVFGIKVHWDQYRDNLLELGLDTGLWAPDVRWVRMTRDDEIRQAVSYVRAAQTRAWNSDMEVVATPVYDEHAIAETLEHLRHENAAWDDHLAAIGAEPLRVSYEQLVTHRESTVRRVLAHIGADVADVPAPSLRPQSDSLNDEWVERFTAARTGHRGPD